MARRSLKNNLFCVPFAAIFTSDHDCRTKSWIVALISSRFFDGSADGGVPELDEPIGHRAIGVVYDPDHERWGNYVPTIIPGRYDAFLYLEESRALDPLHMPIRVAGEAETFPSGM